MIRLLLVALAATACGTPAGDGAGQADGSASAEIGSSDRGFVPLVPDGTIALHAGPQGGFHVYLSVRTTGLNPGTRTESPRPCADAGHFKNPCVDFDIIDLDTGKELDAFVGLHLPLTETSSGVFDLSPPRLVTMAVRSLDEIDGHHLYVSAEVTDASGRTATDGLTATCTPVRL